MKKRGENFFKKKVEIISTLCYQALQVIMAFLAKGYFVTGN
jgi:hypothetical protein